MENLDFFISIFVFILGLIFGSFFNVLIYRLPKGESVVFPRSRCPHCKRIIRFFENIPLLSFIFLGGKCSGCKKRISIQYPLIELVTACLFLFLWYNIALPFSYEVYQWWDLCYLTLQLASLLILIPIAVIDLYHYIIPDSLSLGGLVFAFCISFIPGSITPVESLIGLIFGGGVLYIVGLFGEYILKKQDAMGGGDIKLMAFLGAVWGWKTAMLSIVFGALAGSVIGLVLIMIRVLSKDHKIPFGPFLGVGLWIAVLYGDNIIEVYFRFLEQILF